MKRQYDLTIKGAKVFASANDLNKLSPPLRSRFRRLHLPKYSKDQFMRVAVKVCPNLSKDTALRIGEEVWKSQGDIRDVIGPVRSHHIMENHVVLMMVFQGYVMIINNQGQSTTSISIFLVLSISGA